MSLKKNVIYPVEVYLFIQKDPDPDPDPDLLEKYFFYFEKKDDGCRV